MFAQGLTTSCLHFCRLAMVLLLAALAGCGGGSDKGGQTDTPLAPSNLAFYCSTDSDCDLANYAAHFLLPG